MNWCRIFLSKVAFDFQTLSLGWLCSKFIVQLPITFIPLLPPFPASVCGGRLRGPGVGCGGALIVYCTPWGWSPGSGVCVLHPLWNHRSGCILSNPAFVFSWEPHIGFSSCWQPLAWFSRSHMISDCDLHYLTRVVHPLALRLWGPWFPPEFRTYACSFMLAWTSEALLLFLGHRSQVFSSRVANMGNVQKYMASVSSHHISKMFSSSEEDSGTWFSYLCLWFLPTNFQDNRVSSAVRLGLWCKDTM